MPTRSKICVSQSNFVYQNQPNFEAPKCPKIWESFSPNPLANVLVKKKLVWFFEQPPLSLSVLVEHWVFTRSAELYQKNRGSVVLQRKSIWGLLVAFGFPPISVNISLESLRWGFPFTGTNTMWKRIKYPTPPWHYSGPPPLVRNSARSGIVPVYLALFRTALALYQTALAVFQTTLTLFPTTRYSMLKNYGKAHLIKN